MQKSFLRPIRRADCLSLLQRHQPQSEHVTAAQTMKEFKALSEGQAVGIYNILFLYGQLHLRDIGS